MYIRRGQEVTNSEEARTLFLVNQGFIQAVFLIFVLELRLSFRMLQNAGEGLKVL